MSAEPNEGLRIDPKAIPEAVYGLCRTLRSHGARAWIVGGCVRDQLMGRAVSDWDLCTTALPDALMRIFPKAIPTGLAHGTVTVVVGRERYEVTTLRGDGAYTDGRRPDAVVFLDDITEDLARRDFTVNAIAWNVLDSALVDPFHGAEDLASRVLRAVGDPHRRFHEDGLRILRGARFAATLEFAIAPETEAAMESALEVFRKVSAERVHDEWTKGLKARQPSRAFEVMRRTGILGVTLPALATLPDARFSAALAALDALPKEHRDLRLSALLAALHDDPKRAATLADAWMKAYKFANESRAKVVHLVRTREVEPLANDTDPALRRAIRAIGLDAIDEVFMLRAAELMARGDDGLERALGVVRTRVQGLIAQGVVTHAKDLAIDGTVLMRALGLAPSKRLGELLAALLDAATDDPKVNTPDALLALARSLQEAR